MSTYPWISLIGRSGSSGALRPVSTDLCWLTGVSSTALHRRGNRVALDTSTGYWIVTFHHDDDRHSTTVGVMCASYAELGVSSVNGSFYVQPVGASSVYQSMSTIDTGLNWAYLSGFGGEFVTSSPPDYTYVELSRYSGLGLAAHSGNGYGVAASAVFVRGARSVTRYGQWTSTNTTQELEPISHNVCYLTGLGAANVIDGFSSAFIEPNSATGRWQLRVHGDAFAKAECIGI